MIPAMVSLKSLAVKWASASSRLAARATVQPGAKLIVYETGKVTSAVGSATVVSVNATDPKNPLVQIAAGKSLAKPVSLAEIKANKLFAASPLVRQGRLSVVPLTAEQYHALAGR